MEENHPLESQKQQRLCESHRDDSGQAYFTKEKSNNENFTDNSKHKNLVCNWCHKKGHIRVWLLDSKEETTIY